MPEINIDKQQNGSLHVWSGNKKMQYVHSVTPTSRPDLFEYAEIDDNTEISSTEILLKKYINDSTCKTFKCTSVFSQVGRAEQQQKKNKHSKRTIGLNEK